MNNTTRIDPILDAREAFKDRVVETNSYFTFLEKILNDDFNLNLDVNLRHTLMSVGYLVLYNLVESTSRGYLNLIHTALINERIALEDTTCLIRKVVLDGFRNRKHSLSEGFMDNLSDLRIQIMQECYDKEKIFSGNVDAKLLRDLARKYGFNVPNNCDDLLKVKTKRNDLAHGKISFVEGSRNEAEETIQMQKENIIRYLSKMTENIERFVSNREYCSVQRQSA